MPFLVAKKTLQYFDMWPEFGNNVSVWEEQQQPGLGRPFQIVYATLRIKGKCDANF